jgi:hypothetical protein
MFICELVRLIKKSLINDYWIYNKFHKELDYGNWKLEVSNISDFVVRFNLGRMKLSFLEKIYLWSGVRFQVKKILYLRNFNSKASEAI